MHTVLGTYAMYVFVHTYIPLLDEPVVKTISSSVSEDVDCRDALVIRTSSAILEDEDDIFCNEGNSSVGSYNFKQSTKHKYVVSM